MKKFIISLVFFILSLISYCQFADSGSGLLQMPTAQMEKSGTFMITTNYLNYHTLHPYYWGYYNTLAYGLDITFLSRLEIAYVCALIDGKRKENPSEREKILFNQDRHFSAKLQLVKEGELSPWCPAIAIGCCDPLSAAGEAGYREQSTEGDGSGVFNRYYIALSKRFDTKIGQIGAHMAYQYNRRTTLGYNSPAAGIDWKPIWISKWKNPVLDFVDIMAEYDGRTINVGLIASFWKNHFEAMLELMSLKYIQAGLRYKMILKS